MSRIRSKNTGLERSVCAALRKRGLRFSKHVSSLPGSPDIVFRLPKIAVFMDGDFWHGYRFPQWKSALPLYWREKIEKNRSRDRRNFAALRRMGWKVIRIWGHNVRSDIGSVVDRICSAVDAPKKRSSALI